MNYKFKRKKKYVKYPNTENSPVQLFCGFYSPQVYFQAHHKAVAAIILSKNDKPYVIKKKKMHL